MTRPVGPNRYFPRVKEAREALAAEAVDLYRLYRHIIQVALDAGDVETAMKATQWLIEHMPRDGKTSMVDASVDKPGVVEQKTGPSVNIGFALGGIGEARSLPPAVTIDVEPAGEPDIEANVVKHE